jgi:hypothetical protein
MTQSPELTGGAGFNFEASVAAFYLSAMLANETAPALEDRIVQKVALQQRTFHEPLDDLIIDACSFYGQDARLSLQVKSSLQISNAASKGDFQEIVKNSWKTLRNKDFRQDVDRYGVATGKVADNRSKDLRTVCELARSSQDAQTFFTRFKEDGNTSKSHLRIVNHFRTILYECAEEEVSEHDLYLLLKHFVLIKFDFMHEGATDSVKAVTQLRHTLVASEHHRSPDLWTKLCDLARVGAGRSAEFDRSSLITKLADRFLFAGVLSQTSDDLLAVVKRNAEAAREGLNPSILEPISRSIVQTKYLPAIKRSVDNEGKPRVIPLVGPAGYGKTTILGDIYDELIKISISWVAIVRCNDLIIDPSNSIEIQTLAKVLGEGVCGNRESTITDIASRLQTKHGRGVLLIDTLDLVINKQLRAAFCSVLRELTDSGATVVFTCRDHEYNEYLEPSSQKLPGLEGRIDRYTVPEFTDGEVSKAAQEFVKKRAEDLHDGGRTFANKIFDLSADTHTPDKLREIIHNPLLLALLCDLFARDGDVPPDLTVSKLYGIYWKEKIVYSRFDENHNSVLAIEKEKICLAIAKALFEMSKEKLCESSYQDDLGISFSNVVATAFEALMSEGVLERLRSGKIRFFHQTLLEYAIAYWLNMHSAEEKRSQLLETLGKSDATHSQDYWWPIIRQHLAIVETDEEFEMIVGQLNTNHLTAFGAVASAAASRDKPSVLTMLLPTMLPTAFKLGKAYEERLLLALISAPRQFAEVVWKAMLILLRQGQHKTAINTAKSVSTLFDRWWESLGSHIDKALEAVEKRTPVISRGSTSTDDRSEIFESLLKPCFSVIEQRVDINALSALRKYYLLFSKKTCSQVLHLHLLSGVSKEAQHELLEITLCRPIPNDFDLKKAMTTFLEKILPSWVRDKETDIWKSWIVTLHFQYLEGWDNVLAKAVGRCAANNSELLAVILRDLFEGDEKHIRCNLVAISETISYGKGSCVASTFLATSSKSIQLKRFFSIAGMIKENADTFDADTRESFTKWIEPMADNYPKEVTHFLDAMADGSTFIQQRLIKVIGKLPSHEQEYQHIRMLRFSPIEQHPSITELDKDSQLFLVRFYRTQANTCSSAFSRLLKASVGVCKDVANIASNELDIIARAQLSIANLLSIIEKSKFQSVHVKCLDALDRMTKQGIPMSEEELTAMFAALTNINNQTFVPLCKLVSRWVQTNDRVPLSIVETIGGITTCIKIDGRSARVLISAFKAFAQTENPRLMPKLGEWIRNLLGSIDFENLTDFPESDSIKLFCAVTRLDQDFLSTVVNEDSSVLVNRGWMVVIVKAIKQVNGADSELITKILHSNWCTLEIRNVILKMRRA